MHGVAPAFRIGGAFAALRARADALLGAEWDRLALWLPVAMAGGIVLYFSLPAEPPAWLALLALPPAAAGFALRPERPFSAWLCGLVAAFLLGLGSAALHAALAPPMPELPRGAVELSARVADLEALPDGVRLTLDRVRLSPEAPELRRTVRLRLQRGDPLRPEPGSVIRVRALLRAPAAPAVPGGWDFQRSAFFEGLGASGFAIGRAQLLEDAGGRPLARLRAEVERRVAEAIPGPAGAVAAALLTGRQRAIPPEDIRAMRDSGLAHLLAVSGLHIGIVMGVAFAVVAALLRLFPPLLARADIRKGAALAALLAGLGYLLLTGAAVPVQRAFAMAALVMLGLFLDRTALSLRTVAAAATLVLLLRPDLLLGPSFQMSFAAVLALVAGFEAARPHLDRLRQAPAWWRVPALWAAGLLLSSVLAAAATMPFGLHHFGRLQWYGVAANAVAVPLTGMLVMPAGMAGLLLMPLGLEHWALGPMGWGVERILAVAHAVASWPGAAEAAVPLPAAGAVLAGFGLCWLCLWRTRWRLAGLPILALGLSAGAWQRPPDLLLSADSRWILVRLPEGAFAERGRGAGAFQRDAMLRAWALAAAAPLPRAGAAAGGAIRCDAAGCRIVLPGGEVLLLRARPNEDRPGLTPERCAGVALVVSAAPLRGRCPGVPVLDRFSTWRDGAHSVWVEAGGARVLSDRAVRGDRPWVPPPPRPRPAAPGAEPPPPEDPPEEPPDQ
ncbi:MAG: ComEC family competence protein [Acetobacteraceae bacterium]|nr:ComEC family competence protein [Acetobacteraceae bacterium]